MPPLLLMLMLLLWETAAPVTVLSDYRVSCVDDEGVYPGNVALLRCQVTGAGAEHVRVESWTRDDGLTLSGSHSDGKHCVFPDGSLQVRGVDAKDAARRYRCRTLHAISRETRMAENWATIQLEEPRGLSAPRVVHWLREVSVPAGEGAWLPCVGRGWPTPSARWWRPGTTVEQEGGCAPLLRRASLSDAGHYECVVNNSVGQDRVQTVLQVTDDPPVIVSHFEDSVVSPGQFVSLRCVVRGRPLPRVEWRADGEPVAPSGRLRLGDFVLDSAVHSFLNVSAAEPLDGGRQYECLASGASGRGAARSARLEVRSPPLARPPRNRTLLAGRDTELGCPVAGYPITRFTWEKDGVSLPSSHRHSLGPRGRLLIQQVEKGADDGTYWCEAQGAEPGSAARGRLHIRVVAGPVLEAFSFPAGLREGRRAALACTVSAGDPPISFRWEKDGGPVEGAHVEQLNPFTSTLFVEAAAPRHAGNYTCHATNPYAEDSHTATLRLNIPPRWLVEPEDRGALLGSPVRFDCQAEGHPTPSTRWKQRTSGGLQSDSFRTIVSGSRLQVLENGSLLLPEAGPGGPFLCQAHNGVGPGLSKLVNLALHVPAHFERKSSDQRVRRGEQAILECEAKGDKPLAITWYKEGEAIDNSTSRYRVASSDGSSTLSRLVVGSAAREDSARYSCTASNLYGTDQHTADLTVQEPPDPPIGLEASHVTSRGALIRWSAPFDGHSPILRYTVLIVDTGSSTEVPGSKLEASVRGLRPRTLYGVQVSAENALGRSLPSQPLKLTTDDEVPRSPPSQVKVSAVSSSVLEVAWTPPSEEGTVTGYYVGYRAGTSQYLFKTLRGGERECLLTGLAPSTLYQVKVQAFNEKGPGPHSDEVTAQTLAEPPKSPEIEVAKITSNSIEIAWQSTPNTEGVSAFLRESIVGDWEKQGPLSAPTHRFGGLRCGTEYQLYLAADGRRSPTLTLKTEGRAPVPPGHSEGFLVVNASSAAVLLAGWGDGGCPPLTGYTLRYRAREGGRWVEVPVQGRRAFLTGLRPGHWYKLVAGARNGAGETTVEFDFLTRRAEQQGVLQPAESSAVELQRRVAVITSAVCSTVVLVVILVAACAVLTRRRNRPPPEHTGERREVHKSAESVALSAWEKRTSGALYLPCPYEQQHPYDLPVVVPKIQ